MKRITTILILISIPLYGSHLKVNSLFGNNMVIQHSKTFSIWGTSQPMELVEVQFLGDTFTVNSDKDGRWIIELISYDIGGPYELNIKSDEEIIKYRNVMIGDVWLCSGQSNMNMPLAGWGRVLNYEEEIANAVYPNIRLLTIPLTIAATPQDEVSTDGWDVCSPETIADFSAVAYFFAREVYNKTGVPIGLVHSSKGGTPIESWMCEDALEDRDDLQETIEVVKTSSEEIYKNLRHNYKVEFKKWYNSLADIDLGYNDSPEWFNVNKDLHEWEEMNLPSAWEKQIGKYDGIVWFTRDVVIFDSLIEQSAKLNLGPIQDYDITYFNGQRIGQQNSKNSISVYDIPLELIRKGKNRIVVRVLDLYGPGGLWGVNDKFELKFENGTTIDLSGEWRYKQSLELTKLEKQPPTRVNPDRNPTVLFNGMISPLKDINLAGVLWYQGESNSRNAYQYRFMFERMINHWREHFSNTDLHFYFVQLANYKNRALTPVDAAWAVLRESQSRVLTLKNTGMASAIDIGDQYDVHPKNKQEVGRRLALNALNIYYGKDVAYSGPVYDSMEIEGDTVKISFNHVYDHLNISQRETLNEFTIAGSDKVFHNASAKIIGRTVYVYSSNVTNPVAVRYAWQDNPDVNLYNSEGLPAYPFRTDKWKVVTQ
jgi:sialate O-acetylesterase